jgi:GNAT superfamily N-acetyltransferase
MLFADLATAKRLEDRDATGNAHCVEAYAHLYPNAGARALPVGGGYAVYAGGSSPLTQAIGLGMSGPVAATELDRLERFYWERDVAAHIEVCPLADPTLHSLLAERGYRVEEFSNVLARPLSHDMPQASTQSGVQVRVPTPDEAELWARTVIEGVAPDDADRLSLLPEFLSFFHMPSATCFLASLDDQPAGGGVVSVDRGVAALFAAGTRPQFRNRGVQTALLQTRLHFAADVGCDQAMVITLPGSTSQRNAERQGFRVMYTRSKMVGDGSATAHP